MQFVSTAMPRIQMWASANTSSLHAAESVVLTATAAIPKTNDILFILCTLLQIAMKKYDTTFRPAHEAKSLRNVTATEGLSTIQGAIPGQSLL